MPMRNIVIGNGVDIQFGGLDYTNKSIIERALTNLKNETFSHEVYTIEIQKWIYLLHENLSHFLKGDYDNLAVMKDEKEELETFKSYYTEKTNISEIGFEYYFLLSNLHCRKNGITNPERYYFQEFLRRLFLDSIYNDGKINLIHRNFPELFVEQLKTYDNIFTTNYDSNIETATNENVNYLHGAFHILDPVYDIDSFRNRLKDSPAKANPPVKGYEHCFSNAITGSSGAFKLFSANQLELANSGIEKLTEGYKNNPEIKEQIDKWKSDENIMVSNLHEAIILKVNEPKLEFPRDYAIKQLRETKGEITFMGLSPNNDSHIMKIIRDNTELTKIEFYFYEEHEKQIMESMFSNKTIEFKSIKEYWANKAYA